MLFTCHTVAALTGAMKGISYSSFYFFIRREKPELMREFVNSQRKQTKFDSGVSVPAEMTQTDSKPVADWREKKAV